MEITIPNQKNMASPLKEGNIALGKAKVNPEHSNNPTKPELHHVLPNPEHSSNPTKPEIDSAEKPEERSEKPKKAKPDQSHKNSFLYKFVNNKIIEIIPEIGNIVNIVANALSSFAHVFNVPKKIKDTANKLGDLGTRIFLLTNGTINALEQLERKNYLSAFGYFLENPICLFVDQAKVFLARGFVAGSYTLANALSKLSKDRFESFSEHFKHITEGLSTHAEMLTTDPVKHLKSTESGLLSTISGITMLFGSALWRLTGVETLGATFRDLGGLLQDIEQIKPGYIKTAPYYFISGLGVTAGTIFDYWSKWQANLKPALVPLSLMFDGIGRHFLRKSQLAGELSKEKSEDALKRGFFYNNPLSSF